MAGMRFQPGKRKGEMTAADKGHGRAQGRQRRGVICQQDFVTIRINQFPFGLRVSAPEQENYRLLAFCHVANHRVRQPVPSALGVAGWLPLLNRQAGVEQQNTVFSPCDQTSAWNREGRRRQAQIALNFFEYIAQ